MRQWIKNGYVEKLPFKTVTADEILDFPEMSERYLTIFYTASYQLSEAISYLAEMFDKDAKLTLEYVKKNPIYLSSKYNPDTFLEHHINVS